ncbi:MAG: TonB-dependent receptor, partial [Steroidobacteraceae bacterium]
PQWQRDFYAGLNSARSPAGELLGNLDAKASGGGGSADIDFQLTDAIDSKLIYGHRVTNTDYPTYDIEGNVLPLIMSNGFGQQEQDSIEVNLSGDLLEDRLHWLAGVYYFDEKVELSEPATFLTEVGALTLQQDRRSDNGSKSAFTHLTYSATDRLRLQGGLRYTKDNKKSCIGDEVAFDYKCVAPRVKSKFDYWSWLAGADYQFTDELFGYVKASTGTRSGANPPFLPGQLPVGFDSLEYQPEKVTEYELGIKTELLERRLRINAALFHDKYTDIQQLVPLTAQSGGIVNIILSQGKATIDGVELEITAMPADGLTLTSNVSWLNFDLDDTTRARPQVPRWTGSVAADYERPIEFGSVYGRVEAVYTDERVLSASDTVNATLPYATLDDYTLVNARLGLRFGEHWDAALWGQNLTDKHYYSGGYEFGGGAVVVGYLAQPRTYGLDLSYKF